MSLSIQNLRVGYGAVTALHDVSIEIASGVITTIIGSNGAGKTTIMKAIAGLLPQAAGHVLYNGEELSGLRPSQIVAKGVALVPEGRRLFASMTVAEESRDWRLFAVRQGRDCPGSRSRARPFSNSS